jgi:tRNA-splicing ligase RtcB (3'-phosphate/5'-hydroxy nucleic acid ligase)
MYTLHDRIPVWGQHDEATLAQIARCAADEPVAAAALMADGHKGYSMPIGGVVAYRDTVSPSGVGYDIACLAAGTQVTTADGYWLPIEQVRSAHPLVCWDGEVIRPITQHVGAIIRPRRSTVTVRLDNGRTLTATHDHLLQTRDGWKPAGLLTPDDALACGVFVGLPYESSSAEIPLALPGSRVEAELKARGLYPLRATSPHVPAVIRLLGVISGDGHLALDGKHISVYTTVEADAAQIAADFGRLGYRARVARRERHAGRKAELHVYVTSTALHALFAALGSPVGKKQWTEASMGWLLEVPRWIRALFLSAFCSAEMMTPRIQNSHLANLQLKQAGTDRSGIALIGRLFESLGLAVSIAESGAARGDRRDYMLQLLGGAAAQVRYLEQIGFCYAHTKRVRGAEVASIYWQHATAVQTRALAQGEARAMKTAGHHWKAIMAAVAPRYGVSEGFVYHAIYDDRGQPRVRAGSLTPNTSGEIVWVNVAEVTPAAEAEVYDIVTADPAHCFFALGVVAHNCGNKAVLTDLAAADVKPSISKVMDDITRTVVFGIGQTSGIAADHELFDDPTWRDIREVGALRQQARAQLGTVGSGNHYVDLFEDEQGRLWVGVHFGSRGLGHRTASGFLNLAAGRRFDDKAPGEHMDQAATLLPLDTELGQAYWQAMTLAGRYAYAGRDVVVDQVLGLLGARALEEIHNNHNFAWVEEHGGERLVVVRKGATPAWPGQRGFIGGSMGDISVIVEGVAGDEARAALHSTIHGAGRVMSRTQAAGKRRWTKRGGRRVQEVVRPGAVSHEMMREWLAREGVELRGGGTDESPHVYRRLPEVLAAHAGGIRVLHTLRPLGVAMAGEEVVDPYKD